MKNLLLSFIDNHHFAYPITYSDLDNVEEVGQELDDNNLKLSNLTLELIFLNTNIVKQFLYYIKVLYLNGNNKDYTFVNDITYFDLFNSMYYSYQETLGYRYIVKDYIDVDPYLKNIFDSFDTIKLSFFIEINQKKVFCILYKYYWFNRFNISYQELIDIIKLVNKTGGEIFQLDGIMDERCNLLVNRDQLNTYLDGLFKRKKMIL